MTSKKQLKRILAAKEKLSEQMASQIKKNEKFFKDLKAKISENLPKN